MSFLDFQYNHIHIIRIYVIYFSIYIGQGSVTFTAEISSISTRIGILIDIPRIFLCKVLKKSENIHLVQIY